MKASKYRNLFRGLPRPKILNPNSVKFEKHMPASKATQGFFNYLLELENEEISAEEKGDRMKNFLKSKGLEHNYDYALRKFSRRRYLTPLGLRIQRKIQDNRRL